MNVEPVRIVFASVPVPWARPRFQVNKATGEMHGFTPARVQQNRDYIQKCAADAMEGREPFAKCALEVSALFVLPPPSNLRVSERNLLLAGIPLPVWKRPDLDQYLKHIFDALTGVVWIDDSQVARLRDVGKVYGLKPRIEIDVRPYVVSAVMEERSLFQ